MNQPVYCKHCGASESKPTPAAMQYIRQVFNRHTDLCALGWQSYPHIDHDRFKAHRDYMLTEAFAYEVKAAHAYLDARPTVEGMTVEEMAKAAEDAFNRGKAGPRQRVGAGAVIVSALIASCVVTRYRETCTVAFQAALWGCRMEGKVILPKPGD